MDSQASKLKVEVSQAFEVLASIFEQGLYWWTHLLHWKLMGGASCSRAPKVDFLIWVYYDFHGLGLISC